MSTVFTEKCRLRSLCSFLATRTMTHELYTQVLTGGAAVGLVNTRAGSSKHQLITVVCDKKSLSGYDDKRFIFDDRITTLPYCHHALREEKFMRKMIHDPDWSSSDEEITVDFAESTIEQSPPVTQRSVPLLYSVSVDRLSLKQLIDQLLKSLSP